MRSNRMFPYFFNSAKGLSLLELGIVMVFISLALVPVVKMIGGPTSADGNAAQITGAKNKEALLANTMVNKVLAGDYTGFKCGSNGSPLAFNPDTDLPKSNQIVNFGRCRSQSSNTLYYEWNVLNLTASNNSNSLPSQNQYFQATFNVIDTAGNKLITMPVNFFHNLGGMVTKKETTGVMLSIDTSGSMVWANTEEETPQEAAVASPFMFYRYKKFPSSSDWGNFPNNPPYQINLNMWDDSQLDLTIGKQITGTPSTLAGADPDTKTAYNEAFPFSSVNPAVPGRAQWGAGVLGTGNCSSSSNGVWNSDKNLQYTFIPEVNSQQVKGWVARGGFWVYDGTSLRDYYRSIINDLCRAKNNSTDWSNTINKRLSRIEAARTASLSLLLNLESKNAITSSIEMGFVPWSATSRLYQGVTMEKATVVPGAAGLHFQNMRKRLLWINRADPAARNSSSPILAFDGTNIRQGLETAQTQLKSKAYDRRIIVLLTDGAPTESYSGNTKAALKSYALNSIGMNAPKSQQTTLFTVGLIAADNNLMKSMASSTPDGQHFEAKDVADLKPIFDAISYQIQKLALLSTADRYGLSF